MGRSFQVELRGGSMGKAVHCDGMWWKEIEQLHRPMLFDSVEGGEEIEKYRKSSLHVYA